MVSSSPVTLISQLLLLPTSLLLLITVGGLLLHRRRLLAGWAVIIAGIGGMLVLSMPFTAQRLIHTLQIYAPASFTDLEQVQALVVLGGGSEQNQPEYAGDALNGYTLERIRYAAFLYQRHDLPILVTGGSPLGGEAEGWIMKRELETLFNVPVRWLETESNNTAQNAQFSWPILQQAGVDRIALVTHAWHMPRAKAAFERAGFTVVPAPTSFQTTAVAGVMKFIPQAHYLDMSNTALREWLGLWWYALAVHLPETGGNTSSYR